VAKLGSEVGGNVGGQYRGIHGYVWQAGSCPAHDEFMAPKRPVPRLYVPIGEFGRRGKRLSVERLEREACTILNAVGTEDELADWYKRRDLAVRVEALLRSIVASLKDPVDRRVAEAVLATKGEFVEKTVERRKQLLYEENGITEEQFKERRPHVVEQLAAALEGALANGVVPASVDEPDAHADLHTAPTSTEPEIVDPVPDTGRPGQTRSRMRSSRRRLVLTMATAATLALLGVAGGVVLAARDPWNGMTAAELERRYDGKLPWGDDDDSRCADLPNRPETGSRPIDPSNDPPVMGPEGSQVGTVQLRYSTVCPTAVWARILWHGDGSETYSIPVGWTVHSVMHRPSTNSRIEELDHWKSSEVPYIVSRMIASAGGCVWAEVYFTQDNEPDRKTAIARTACVQV
jgi:hypothetical protein